MTSRDHPRCRYASAVGMAWARAWSFDQHLELQSEAGHRHVTLEGWRFQFLARGKSHASD
eukprot:CAMPEP_0183333324 /NCGR_PEP_ID=MMETSP0164_2-20130417/2249_1 /TAXON_ID=221442 /ORGANISM="Coccolithus pelagicus ssp braarudi, Strain PLY182g" /LENGTH=59 /DNA_ID=CAMNT_0025502225 /DNA_START=101 /DNA_END=280 /DNA_ORIENTATION=-